jgi:hypothetical protein
MHIAADTLKNGPTDSQHRKHSENQAGILECLAKDIFEFLKIILQNYNPIENDPMFHRNHRIQSFDLFKLR